jgi:acetoacetyl-CoA synthetase
VETAPFTDEISDTLCVGRRRPSDRDEEVFLFVVMKPGKSLSRRLIMSIKTTIGKGLSPRHVPRFVLEVPEIPVTINGKKVEAAVKQTISGKDVTPSNTVTNPDSIGYFKRFRDLEREPGQAKL